jgi:hypothetical protein
MMLWSVVFRSFGRLAFLFWGSLWLRPSDRSEESTLAFGDILGTPVFRLCCRRSSGQSTLVRALGLRIPELLFLAPKADERTLTRVAEGLRTKVA